MKKILIALFASALVMSALWAWGECKHGNDPDTCSQCAAERKREKEAQCAAVGATLGATAGGLTTGPAGALVGGTAGAVAGYLDAASDGKCDGEINYFSKKNDDDKYIYNYDDFPKSDGWD